MADIRQSALTLTACDTALLAVLLRRRCGEAATQGLKTRFNTALPAPGRMVKAGDVTLLWNGPDRFLALRDGDDAGFAAQWSGVFGDLAHVVPASSSRVVLEVAGKDAAEALNRLLPIDLHPRAFPPGSAALTIAAHIDVQVWRPSGAPLFRLACASSVAASFYLHAQHALRSLMR